MVYKYMPFIYSQITINFVQKMLKICHILYCEVTYYYGSVI